MRFHFISDERLPHLAWATIFEKGNSLVTVVHGDWVETGEDFFFEGSWAGAFSEAEFDDCPIVFGSGGKLRKDEVVLCGPSSTLARLHMVRRDNVLVVSNSFVFCIVASGAKLRSGYAMYFRDLHSICRGLNKYRRKIPLEEDVLEITYFDNIMVRADLSTHRHPKPFPASFSNFQEYNNFLKSRVGSIAENAKSPQRKVQFEPFVSVSSGYDSPAAAVLAKLVGCKESVTFPETSTPNVDDSGREIAERLGMHVIEADRLNYRKMNSFPEAEFIATGGAAHAGDVIFSSLGEQLERRLLFTGFNGDHAWSMAKNPGRTLHRYTASGSALEEFRLQAGFIHLPVPYIGAMRNPEIHEISRSAEMKPWIIEGNYNRPIPRRIVEQAGIPRKLFGLSKKAAGSRIFDNALGGPSDLEPLLSRTSFDDYASYFQENYRRSRSETFYEIYRLMGGALFRLTNLFNNPIATTFSLEAWEPKILSHYAPKTGKNWLAFFWAVEKVSERYQTESVQEILEGIKADETGEPG